MKYTHTCPQCLNVFKARKRVRKYCSKKCQVASPSWMEQMRQLNSPEKGKNAVSFHTSESRTTAGVTIRKGWKDPVIREKHRKSMSEVWNRDGYSDHVKKAISDAWTQERRDALANFAKSDYARKRNRESWTSERRLKYSETLKANFYKRALTMIKKYGSASGRNCNTKPEQDVEALLKQMGVRYLKQVPMHRTTVDFYLQVKHNGKIGVIPRKNRNNNKKT